MADVNPAETLAGMGTKYIVVRTLEEAIRLFPDRLYVAKTCAEFFHGGCSAVVVQFTGRGKLSKFHVSKAASASDSKISIAPEVMAECVEAIQKALFDGI